MKKEKTIEICRVISKLVERIKKLKMVGDICYGMEFVIRQKLKYVGLKTCNYFNKYLQALKQSLEIWYA
jgi:hypothetical protein